MTRLFVRLQFRCDPFTLPLAVFTALFVGCSGGTTAVGIFPGPGPGDDAGTERTQGPSESDPLDAGTDASAPSGPLHVTAVAVGGEHACALLSDGTLKCWGRNDHGQLGDGSMIESSKPVAVVGLPGRVKSISLGYASSCAILESGSLVCWGYNEFGQIGDGSLADRTSPVATDGLPSGVLSAMAGANTTCAVLTGGAVRCWGYNAHGELGNGTTSNSAVPVAVSGLDSGVSSISIGGGRTCALLEDGSVRCWGLNDAGQLGDGTKDNRTTPVQIIGAGPTKEVSVGWLHTCVLRNGEAVCRGYNGWGELGDGTFNDNWSWTSTPSSVSTLGTDARSVAASLYHSCAIRASSGGVVCWGGNNWGQVGDGTHDNRSSARPVIGARAVSLGVGARGNCALLASGELKCWGANDHGQLGTTTTETCVDGQETLPCSSTPLTVQGVL